MSKMFICVTSFIDNPLGYVSFGPQGSQTFAADHYCKFNAKLKLYKKFNSFELFERYFVELIFSQIP